MCGVVAEGSSSRICQHHPLQPWTTNNSTGMMTHVVGSTRTMTHSQEEVHRRWWWRGPGIEPLSSSSTTTTAQPPQHSHSAGEEVEQLQNLPLSRLSCSSQDITTMPEILITSRRADTTCSSVNNSYSRSSRSTTSRLDNVCVSSKYQLGSRELQCNNNNNVINNRLCTDTLEQSLSFCDQYSSLESACNVGLRCSSSRKASSSSRKASSDSVDVLSVYSNDSRKFSLRNNSMKPTDSTKMGCSSAIRSSCRSGSRRFFGLSSQQWIVAVTLLFLASFTGVAESCSSRSTPKPRPPSPTSRPNVTFLTYACPPAYAAWYCLNGATCFTVKIGDSILYNCECADGYMGQRCEFKDLDGSYLPARDKVLLQTASIAGGATLAVVLVFIVLFSLYVVRQRDKENKDADENNDRKPFSGYQNLHSETFLSISNPYVQIEEDVSVVKIVPPSCKKIFQGDENGKNIPEIFCNNRTIYSDIITESASENKNINNILTPS